MGPPKSGFEKNSSKGWAPARGPPNGAVFLAWPSATGRREPGGRGPGVDWQVRRSLGREGGGRASGRFDLPVATLLNRTYIRKLKYKFQFWSVSGRFPAKVGPGGISNGPGLENAT